MRREGKREERVERREGKREEREETLTVSVTVVATSFLDGVLAADRTEPADSTLTLAVLRREERER